MAKNILLKCSYIVKKISGGDFEIYFQTQQTKCARFRVSTVSSSASCQNRKKVFFFLNDTCIIPPSKIEYPRGMKTAVIPNNPLRCHHVMNAAPGRTLTETPFLRAQRRVG